MLTEENSSTLPALGEGGTPGELKAVLAAAMKIAAENGLEGAPAADTPVEELCDTAGFAVEESGAMQQLAAGEVTVAEALDMAGRASVAVACRAGTRVVQSAVAAVPVFGPILSVFTGILFTQLRTPQFTEKVYTTVKTTAVSAWGWAKQKTSGIRNRIANKLSNWLNA